MNSACNAIPVLIYTRDHQADTISTLMDRIKAFKATHDNDQLSFELVSGNLGVMAAINEVVHAGDCLVNGALFASARCCACSCSAAGASRCASSSRWRW